MKALQPQWIATLLLIAVTATAASASPIWEESAPWEPPYSYANNDPIAYTTTNGSVWNLYKASANAVNTAITSPVLATDFEVAAYYYYSTQGYPQVGITTNPDGQYFVGAGDLGRQLQSRKGIPQAVQITVPEEGYYKWVGDIMFTTFSTTSYVRFGSYNADGSGWQQLGAFSQTHTTGGNGVDIVTVDSLVNSVYLHAGDILVVAMGATSTNAQMRHSIDGGSFTYNVGLPEEYTVTANPLTLQFLGVPEPASLGLLMVGTIAIASRRLTARA